MEEIGVGLSDSGVGRRREDVVCFICVCASLDSGGGLWWTALVLDEADDFQRLILTALEGAVGRRVVAWMQRLPGEHQRRHLDSSIHSRRLKKISEKKFQSAQS